jgi:hypothetical protein
MHRWSTQPAGITKDFNGCVQLMKNYVITRINLLDSRALDVHPLPPNRVYIGPSNYPLRNLPFSVPATPGTVLPREMASCELRDSMHLRLIHRSIHYEIESVWESGELTNFVAEITLPSAPLKVGHAYRVRVQMKDSTSRWSRWSDPIQFFPNLPENATILAASLRLTELMYQPPAGNDFEFIEIYNTNALVALDLSGV